MQPKGRISTTHRYGAAVNGRCRWISWIMQVQSLESGFLPLFLRLFAFPSFLVKTLTRSVKHSALRLAELHGTKIVLTGAYVYAWYQAWCTLECTYLDSWLAECNLNSKLEPNLSAAQGHSTWRRTLDSSQFDQPLAPTREHEFLFDVPCQASQDNVFRFGNIHGSIPKMHACCTDDVGHSSYSDRRPDRCLQSCPLLCEFPFSHPHLAGLRIMMMMMTMMMMCMRSRPSGAVQ